MSKAYIKAISYITPSKTFTNDDLVKEFPEWSVDKVASKVGISNRFIARDDESTSELSVLASEKLFTEHNINRDIIDFVILCTQSPDYSLPTTACIIQDRLGLKTSCGAFDFNLGCSGYTYGLAIAKGLIESKIAHNILFITAETYSKYLAKDDKSNRTIFGDAASATLISNRGYASIEDFVLGTDGSGAENLIVRNSGSKKDLKQNDKLYMNGAEIYNFTLRSVPKLVENISVKNKILDSEIDLFILHQANMFMLNHLRRKMKIDQEKFYTFMDKVGNTVSSTIPIALYNAINEKRIKNKDNVLIAGFGVGYSWGGTILKFNDNKIL
jgi:3-oxoacyl-[acyl-carrier-protein] synthase-3